MAGGAQIEWILKRHILPALGSRKLSDIDPSTVRAWSAPLSKRYPATGAKAYRLLSSIMRAAMADELIVRNPCQVKGAATERTPERPTASVAEVTALVEAVPDYLRVAMPLAAWCQLRRGELLGLRRRDVDLVRGTLTIELTRGPRLGGSEIVKGPKTEAGRRTMAIPELVLPDLRHHEATYVGSDADAPLLVGEKGRALVKSFTKEWTKARDAIGRPELRLHDLRHSGLTWSAATGATLAELMHRAGHKSPVAALRYQHATSDRDRALADALSELGRKATVVPLRPEVGRPTEDHPSRLPRDGRSSRGFGTGLGQQHCAPDQEGHWSGRRDSNPRPSPWQAP
jgi:integrase